jgi:hypothetical protein
LIIVLCVSVLWSTLGADVLRPDRRSQRRDLPHVVTRAGALRDLRARPEAREMGEGGTHT